MIQNDEISILIGAGFSTEAGIPARNEINARLKNLKATEFIIHSEGTTVFLKQPDPNSHWLNVIERNFVEAMISFYNSSIAKDFDYEEFYDYCYNLSNSIVDFQFETFFHNYVNEKKNGLNKGQALYIVIRTIEYLVSELLRFNHNIFETNIIDNYQPFLNLLRNLQKQFQKINIFSLNHDLLI